MTARENWLWLFTLLAPALLSGCGVVRPPLPPSLDLPQSVQDLRAIRKADYVTLAWTLPTQTTDDLNIRHMGPTRICRRQDQPVVQCAPPLRSLQLSQLNLTPLPPAHGEKHPAQQQASVTDAIDPALSASDPTGFFSYAVETLNQRGRSAGFSNQVRVPLAPTLPPPTNLQAEATAQGVVITWNPVSSPHEITGLTHRYRIYRRDAATKADSVAGEIPLPGAAPARFVDGGFQWGGTFLYRITVVTVINTDELGSVEVEGADSPPVEVKPVDIYPPAVPVGLQAVYSGAGQQPFVDLTWSADTDADLAGYNVYRRQQEGTKPEKLNSDLLRSPAYRDATVAAGKRYFYSVSAVDVRGNESARSAEAAESTPP